MYHFELVCTFLRSTASTSSHKYLTCTRNNHFQVSTIISYSADSVIGNDTSYHISVKYDIDFVRAISHFLCVVLILSFIKNIPSKLLFSITDKYDFQLTVPLCFLVDFIEVKFLERFESIKFRSIILYVVNLIVYNHWLGSILCHVPDASDYSHFSCSDRICYCTRIILIIYLFNISLKLVTFFWGAFGTL